MSVKTRIEKLERARNPGTNPAHIAIYDPAQPGVFLVDGLKLSTDEVEALPGVVVYIPDNHRGNQI